MSTNEPTLEQIENMRDALFESDTALDELDLSHPSVSEDVAEISQKIAELDRRLSKMELEKRQSISQS